MKLFFGMYVACMMKNAIGTKRVSRSPQLKSEYRHLSLRDTREREDKKRVEFLKSLNASLVREKC